MIEAKCNQILDGGKKCGLPGAYRFTWLGKDEKCICAKHAPQLAAVAEAMGMHLQLIPLTLPAAEGERE